MRNFPVRSKRIDVLKRLRGCQPRIEFMEPRALLSAVAWTGAGGDNNWDTAANWSTDSVPGPADDVTIAIAANVVHSNSVTDSINSLTSAEPLTISGGTLSIAAASSINNTLSMTGGTLSGAGDVSVGGLVTLTAGTLSGSGALDANGGMSINPTGGNFFLAGRTVNNAAGQTATWTGTLGNFIEASNGSVFNNMGSFVDGGLGLYEETGTGAPSAFNDAGSFTTSAGSTNSEFGVFFNVPGGSIDVTDNNQLDIDRGGTMSAAALTIGANAALGLGTYVLDTATTIIGTGELEAIGTKLVLPGNYTFTGSLFVERGTMQVDGSLAASSVGLSDSPNTTLSGTGTVGAMSVGDGTVSPGDGPVPGILNAHGDVAFSPPNPDEEDVGSTFNVVLNGAAAGTGYSQLNVNGSVDLGGSTLNTSLGFTPANGETFTIIKSTSPIVGTFDGLPEGASLTIGNFPFTISYHGGDGNDVVLTQANAVPIVPAVTGISPTTGPSTGGTVVTITGTGFTGAIGVDFGTTAATGFTVVSDTEITADSPAGTGTVDVTVGFGEFRTARSETDLFTYTTNVAPPVAAPTVTGISPSSGPASGGTSVTITGTGFTGATAVDFGTTAATGVIVLSATTITADSPAGTGIANVTVITPAGTSATSSADQFTFIAAAPAAPPPSVMTIERFGVHMQPTAVVLTFSSALDATRATNVHNYQFVTMGGRGKFGNLVGHVTRVRSAVYNPATLTVTLFPAQRLNIHNMYRLTVNGATPAGLRGSNGMPLAGRGNGVTAVNYVALLSGKLLAGSFSAASRPPR